MAENINELSIQRKPVFLLEPDAFLPPGVEGLYLKEQVLDDDIDYQLYQSGDIEEPLTTELLSDGEEIVDTAAGFVPETVLVASQEVKFGPDGKQVVDVVIEILDAPEGTKFDVRITKI